MLIEKNFWGDQLKTTTTINLDIKLKILTAKNAVEIEI
jgi:hypothetical protein